MNMPTTVLITGASKGIGAATAIAFGKAGYDVIVNYNSDKEAADSVVDKIKSANGNAVAVQADVFTEVGVNKLFDFVKSEYDKLDVLINNAGHPEEPSFGEYTFSDITKSLSGNFIGTVLCTQAAVPLMQSGCILFNSSIFGMHYGGNPELALYSAGKAAVTSFMQTMAEALADKNIRCNAVAPGFTKTPAWEGTPEEYIKTCLNMTLQKEWVEPEEIAETFLFLAKTPHINAETIIVDAGWMKKASPN